MNVLVVCPVFEPYSGGGGQYFPLLVRELAGSPDIGNVVVLTENHPDREMIERDGSITVYRMLVRRDTVKKGRVYKTISFFYTYCQFAILIPRLVSEYDINVIHYTRYMRKAFFKIMEKCKRSQGVKVVVDMRATLESDDAISGLFGVDCIMSNSEAVYNQVARLLSDKFTHELVKNPIALPHRVGESTVEKIKNKYLLSGQKYLLMVGQLMPRKSTEEVVDAYPLIKELLPDHKLVLVGRNMLGEGILKKIADHGICYLGPLNHEDTMILIEGADLVIQPSKIEGIPRVSIESLALGKKVLLPPCAPELIRDNGFFTVPTYEADVIGQKVVEIVNGDKYPDYDLSNHDIQSSIAHVVQLYKA